MKAKYIFVFALLTLLAINVTAAENAHDINFDETPPTRFRPSEERIDNILERIAQDNPEQAEELEKMRLENPEMFREKLREYIMQQMQQRRPERPKPGVDGQPQAREMRQRPERPDGPERQRIPRIENRREEYLEWFEENYPDEFARLEELKEKDPNLYFRQMVVSGRQYGRIFEASQTNPELAEILKEDMLLKQKRQELLRKIYSAQDEEKEELTRQLEDIVGQRFDLILKRKQIAYDELRERLEKIKEEVKQSQTEVEKWKDSKDVRVNERVSELLKRTEKFNWED